jgi:hypothetical protein
MRNRGYHLCSELALDKHPSLRAGAKRQRHNSPRTGILLVCLLACLVLCLSPSPSQHTLAQGGLSIRESRVLVGAGAVRADPRTAASKPRACVRNLRWHDGWHGKGDAEPASPPRLLSPTNPAIAGEGPLSPPTPQGAPSRSHHPCRRRAVPVQSCSSPAACRSRVFTELLVRSTSVRCTTVVPPREDCSMTAVLHTARCNYSGNDDEKVTTVLCGGRGF